MSTDVKARQGAADGDAYATCVLEQLRRTLNRRDVFAAPSNWWLGGSPPPPPW